jgi:GNAT superfamily N-acetyltransferase
MTGISLQIQVVDPQGVDALALLREAAIEARALYPELHDPNAPLPTNPPTPPRGIYILVYHGAQPVGSGALRPMDESTVEIRRMYVLKEYRRHGVAGMILEALEREAARLGYTSMRLETGNRQTAAMRLYESYGFTQLPPFGPYVNDPISVCYEKPVQRKQVFNAHV